jgi:UDP-N-acetylmuramoyl-tripeptide--D-alanyl-D-alanine ligase
VVDDAYNANPASMRGALATMAELARLTPGVRQALVLGTMHELGGAAPELHHAVGAAAGALAPALVVTTGPEAAALAAGVRATSPGGSRVLAVGDISEAAEVLASVAATASPASPLQVLLKGSRAERLERAVALLSPAAAPETRGGA